MRARWSESSPADPEAGYNLRHLYAAASGDADRLVHDTRGLRRYGRSVSRTRYESVLDGSAEVIAKKFHATLERSNNALNWVIVRIPFSVEKTWGTRGQLKVYVRVNGAEFQSCLFPSRTGVHFMIVNKQMQRSAEVRVGETAEFVFEPDLTKREVQVPVELKDLLHKERDLAKWYVSLNDATRADISRWIAQPKTEASRARRTEQIAERMMETMEAEAELPPLIRRALACDPLADDGWKLMTPAQRRSHLLGIFYYRTPEARERRLRKALEAATEIAEKRRHS